MSIARKPGTWKRKVRRRRPQTREYRDKALVFYGPTCIGCGFDEHPKLLDIHHKDKDPFNNKMENLQVLCVMCHAKNTRLGQEF